jgi:5'-deoxynucleotidase YfbR-like HD superfamily hydrolase
MLDHITLEGVAQSLAHIHRYNGVFGPASVADHSVRVGQRLPRHSLLRLAGLMHDVAECVTGDLTRVVKPLAPDVVAIEERWQGILCRRLLGAELGALVRWFISDPFVKVADDADGEWEQAVYLKREIIPPYSGTDSAAAWCQAVRRAAEEWRR